MTKQISDNVFFRGETLHLKLDAPRFPILYYKVEDKILAFTLGCFSPEGKMGEVELYKMKISRIGELEKIASSAFVVFLVGALFQARVNPNNLGDTLGFLLILCVLSVISIHFFVLNASYFVDIVELEEKLNVEHMGKIFFHWGSHLSITLSFLYLSVPLIFIASVWYTLLSQADVIRLSIAFVSTLIYCVVLVILVRKPLEAYRTMLKSRNERKITITSIEEVKSSQSNEGTVA